MSNSELIPLFPSGLISFPFPGAVNVRSVDKILEAIGIAGWVADGKRGMSSPLSISYTSCYTYRFQDLIDTTNVDCSGEGE
jgi:hypothetical protein